MAAIQKYLSLCQSSGIDPIFELVVGLSDPDAKKIDLSSRKISLGDKELITVGQVLSKSSNIRELDVSNNTISSSGIKLFKSFHLLTLLNISNNSIEDPGCQFITAAVLKSAQKKLRILHADNVGMTDTGFISLCQLLKENILQDFSCSKNRISDNGLSFLATILKVNFTCRKLNLANNSINDSSFRNLSIAIKQNTSLEFLDLSGNNVTDVGVKFIADALRNNRGLKVLKMNFNSIRDNGAIALSEMIAENECLEELHIAYNQIMRSGIISIFESLQKNTSLRVLDVTGVILTASEVEILGKVVSGNRNLEKLFINVEEDRETAKLVDRILGSGNSAKIVVNEERSKEDGSGIGSPGRNFGGGGVMAGGGKGELTKTVFSYNSQLDEMKRKMEELQNQLQQERGKRNGIIQELQQKREELTEKDQQLEESAKKQQLMSMELNQRDRISESDQKEQGMKVKEAVRKQRELENEREVLNTQIKEIQRKYEMEKDKIGDLQRKFDNEREKIGEQSEGATQKINELKFQVNLHEDEVNQFREGLQKTKLALEDKNRDYNEMKSKLESELDRYKESDQQKSEQLQLFSMNVNSQLKTARLEKAQLSDKLKKEEKFVNDLQQKLVEEKNYVSQLENEVKEEKRSNQELNFKIESLKDELLNYIDNNNKRNNENIALQVDSKIRTLWDRMSVFLKQFEEKLPENVERIVEFLPKTQGNVADEEKLVEVQRGVLGNQKSISNVEKEVSQVRRFLQNNPNPSKPSFEMEGQVELLKKKYLELKTQILQNETLEKKVLGLVERSMNENKQEINAMRNSMLKNQKLQEEFGKRKNSFIDPNQISQILEKQQALIGGLRDEFNNKLGDQRNILTKIAQENKWIEDEGIRLRVEQEEHAGKDVRQFKVQFKNELERIDSKIDHMFSRQKEFFSKMDRGLETNQSQTFSKFNTIENTLNNMENQMKKKEDPIIRDRRENPSIRDDNPSIRIVDDFDEENEYVEASRQQPARSKTREKITFGEMGRIMEARVNPGRTRTIPQGGRKRRSHDQQTKNRYIEPVEEEDQYNGFEQPHENEIVRKPNIIKKKKKAVTVIRQPTQDDVSIGRGGETDYLRPKSRRGGGGRGIISGRGQRMNRTTLNPRLQMRPGSESRSFVNPNKLNYSTLSHRMPSAGRTSRKSNLKGGTRDVGAMGDRLNTLNKRINNLETFFREDQEQSVKAIEHLLTKSKIAK